jgi:gas vesicle protein
MRTFWAILGGAAIGAGAGLLFAPRSGRATRAFLRDKATKYGHDAEHYVDRKSRHLQNKMQGYRHEAEKLMARGEEMINQGREKLGEIRHRGEEMMHHGEEMIEHGRDAVEKMKVSVSGENLTENPTEGGVFGYDREQTVM